MMHVVGNLTLATGIACGAIVSGYFFMDFKLKGLCKKWKTQDRAKVKAEAARKGRHTIKIIGLFGETENYVMLDGEKLYGVASASVVCVVGELPTVSLSMYADVEVETKVQDGMVSIIALPSGEKMSVTRAFMENWAQKIT